MSPHGKSVDLVAPLGHPNPFQWHHDRAHAAMRETSADLALYHLKHCQHLVPKDWYVPFTMAQIHINVTGDIHEAIRLFKYARHLRERTYTPKTGKPPYRFMDVFWGSHIGHIANIEHLLKRDILLGLDPKNIVLLRPKKCANQALLDKFASYITVVNSESELPLPRASMLSVQEDYYICESIDGFTKHWWHASPEIFRVWEKNRRKPLLSLTDEEFARGRSALRSIGIPNDKWFVALHVRESGFKLEHGLTKVEMGLNADLAAYLPAIQAVVERGGTVIRIGDSSMSPLPRIPGAFDYARSALKSDWMDIYLLGACRFFIGTSSGPAYVPPLFGVPCVLTNWFPTGQRPFNGRDIFIPKMVRLGKPPRVLRFEDMVAPPIGYAVHWQHAKDFNYSLIPNTPEQLRDVVVEMLDRLDGKLTYSEEDVFLQQTFDAVADVNFCYGNARMGRDFLREHRGLLV